MSSNKRTLWIIIAVISIILIFVAILFEIRDVPDVSWKKTYDFEEKAPNGFWLFSELIEELYPSAEILVADTSNHLKDDFGSKEVLYIKMANRYAPDETTMGELSEFLKNDNEALLLVRNTGDSLSLLLQEYECYIYGWSDTIISVTWDDIDEDLRDTLSYIHYNDEFQSGANYNYKYLSNWSEDSIGLNPDILSIDDDSSLVYGRFMLEDEGFYLHTIPGLYTNMALKQEDMVRNMERTFSYFDPDIVILDGRQDRVSRNISAEDTPMDYVLAQPSLRWAYYLLILGLLTYVIFRGRRRQRIIPVAPRYDNTSLDHVEMLAQLYGSQQQHNKLIGHMRKLFFHKNEQRYFIKPSNQDYTKLLSQKSKVPIEEIEILMNRFDKVGKSKRLNAYDLNVFYKTLQRFYDKCR